MTTKRSPETRRAINPGWETTTPSDRNSIHRRTGGWLVTSVWLLIGTVSLFNRPAQAQTRRAPEVVPGPITERWQPSAPVFVENRGQWADSSVRFAVKTGPVNVGVTDTGLRFQWLSQESRPGWNDADRAEAPEPDESLVEGSGGGRPPVRPGGFTIQFVGTRPVRPEGEAKARPVFHFQQGPPGTWRENVPSWNSVIYRGLYDGIDLRVQSVAGAVRYEIIVGPGADWRQVRLQYHGGEGIDSAGHKTPGWTPEGGWPTPGERAVIIRRSDGAPLPELTGQLAAVDGSAAALVMSEQPDSTQALVVEGEIEWSMAIGGTAEDSANGITVDRAGNLLVTGATSSSGWVSEGAAITMGGSMDAFVAKFAPDGSLLWSRYLGGMNSDAGRGIATDSADNIVVAGTTASSGWVHGGFETVKFYDNPLEYDPFVVKLNPDGTHRWSTYLGEGDFHTGAGVAVDPSDDILVTGITSYLGWAATQVRDGYVIKLNRNGRKLWWAPLGDYNAYPGSPDGGNSVAADSHGNVLVTGYTSVGYWIRGGQDTSYDGGTDAFVAKFSPGGTRVWSTYLGGTGRDVGYAIRVDSADNILVGGGTVSRGWIEGGFDTLPNGGEDGFITKLKPDGKIAWSTYLGGLSADRVRGITSDPAGNVFVAGSTSSPGWIRGGSDTSYQGAGDAFVMALDAAGTNLWSTYLGGEAEDLCNAVAVDPAGNLVVAGNSRSKGWTTAGFDTNRLRGQNAFVARLRAPSGSAGCRLATPEPRLPRKGKVGTTTPRLWWADVTDESGYVVNVYAGPGPDGTLIHTSPVLPPDTTAYAVPESAGLLDGQTNSWQVKALGDGGMTCDSSWSSLFTFTVKTNLAPDKTRPTVQITSPPPQSRVFGPMVTVAGTAGDNRGVAEVRYRVNDGNWAQASGTANWRADVPLPPGSNLVQAFSVDGSGLVSATNRLRLYAVPLSELTLLTNGQGSIYRQFSGTLLEIGRTYQVRAVPAADHAFSHWSGSVAWTNPTNPTLRFVMVSNLVIEANFVPDPFEAAQGVYHGLFFAETRADSGDRAAENPAPIEAASSGFATLTLTRRGVASGVIVIAGRRHSFGGVRFDRNGSGHARIGRGAGQPPLMIDLRLNPDNDAALGGTISGENGESGLLAFRTESRAGQAGRYTFVLAGGAADDVAAPTGYGAGVLRVAANGSLRLAGRLADGTPFSRASGHSRHGWWPLYLPLQAGQGGLLGWTQFRSEPGGYDLLGTNRWLKAAATTTGQFYPRGFAVMRELWGARYETPARGQPVQAWTGGILTFTDGNLATSLRCGVAWVDDQLVVQEDSRGVTVRVNRANGLFRGHLLHPATGRRSRFEGALLQRPGWGAGWFLGTNRAGSIRIEPGDR